MTSLTHSGNSTSGSPGFINRIEELQRNGLWKEDAVCAFIRLSSSLCRLHADKTPGMKARYSGLFAYL